MEWEAWAIFRKGQLLYDRFFFEKEQAYLYKLVSYESISDEDCPADFWMMTHGITIERVIIKKVEDIG